MSRSQRHDTEFLAIDRNASDWALHRARLVDRHVAYAIDRRLAAMAAEGRMAIARQEVARHRRALGKPDLLPACRHRTASGLAAAAERLQRAFRARIALDRAPSSGNTDFGSTDFGNTDFGNTDFEGNQPCPTPPET